MQFEKEEMMIDKMIVYVEKSQGLSKIFLALISEFSKFAGYKIDIEIQSFFYILTIKN